MYYCKISKDETNLFFRRILKLNPTLIFILIVINIVNWILLHFYLLKMFIF